MITANARKGLPKIAVITCITCGMDILHEPMKQSIDTDFFCFYDVMPQKEVRSAWRMLKAIHHPPIKRNGKLVAKWYKMQSHKIRKLSSYQYILWVDGSVQIKHRNFVRDMVHTTSNSICVFRHPWRNCLYAEYEKVKASSECRVNDVLLNQIKAYAGIRYPAKNGLYCCTVLGRYRTERADRVMDAWWEEINKYSMRDQISFPYVLWKNRVHPDIFPGDIYKNRYIEKCSHTAYYYHCYRRT